MAAVAVAPVPAQPGNVLENVGTEGLVEIRGELVLKHREGALEMLAPTPCSPTRLPAPETSPKAELGQVLSPTQVRTFLNCSARWWFKYGMGEPETKNSALA